MFSVREGEFSVVGGRGWLASYLGTYTYRVYLIGRGRGRGCEVWGMGYGWRGDAYGD